MLTTIPDLRMVITFQSFAALNQRAGTPHRRAPCLLKACRLLRTYCNVPCSSNLGPTMASSITYAISPSPLLLNSSRTLATWRCFATSPPAWNPQNCDQPLVLPSPDFSAEDCVCAQLDALAKSNEPWQGHGIQLCYEFGLDIGGMDPSVYFGFPKDLYHLG